MAKQQLFDIEDPKNRVSRFIYRRVGDSYFLVIDLRCGYRGCIDWSGGDGEVDNFAVRVRSTKSNRCDSEYVIVSWRAPNERLLMFHDWSKGTLHVLFSPLAKLIPDKNPKWVSVKESYEEVIRRK